MRASNDVIKSWQESQIHNEKVIEASQGSDPQSAKVVANSGLLLNALLAERKHSDEMEAQYVYAARTLSQELNCSQDIHEIIRAVRELKHLLDWVNAE